MLRCNRVFAHTRHATNAGGAVATRDCTGQKGRHNISLLMRKWPGVFHLNAKRKDEVIMKWPRPGATRGARSVLPETSSLNCRERARALPPGGSPLGAPKRAF